MPAVKINEQQKEQALKAAVGIAVLVLCYMAMIAPVLRDIAFFHQSMRDSQKRIELYREVGGLKESFDRSESALATLAERSQLLGKISDIAGRTQLHIETLTPRTEPDGEYIKLRMEVDGQGTFFSLLKFMQAIEKIGAAIKLRSVSLLRKFSPGSPKGIYSLQIQLVFETLLKQRVKKINV